MFIRHSRYYVWIIRQLTSEVITSDSIFFITWVLDSTLQINHKMSAFSDKLLFHAAESGDLAKVKELLSKGVGTSYRDGVRKIIIHCYLRFIYYYCCCSWWWWWCLCVLLHYRKYYYCHLCILNINYTSKI